MLEEHEVRSLDLARYQKDVEPFVLEVRDALEKGNKVKDRKVDAVRELFKSDLAALLMYGTNAGRFAEFKAGARAGELRFHDDWIIDRCRDVQFDCNRVLDLWFREAGKSTIKTHTETIRRLLIDPELRFGIFSHTKPIAKRFMHGIRREFMVNRFLIRLFPDRLWTDPQKEAPTWSKEDGITIKRRGEPRENSIEAYGLVDGQPVSRHYDVLLYDDVVTKESINTTEQISKTTKAWEESLDLGTEGCELWGCGTIWTYGDTWHDIVERGAMRARLIPVYGPDWDRTIVDKETGLWQRLELPETPKAVYLSQGYVEQKERDKVATFGPQMLLDPRRGIKVGFDASDIQWYEGSPIKEGRGKIRYILVDPADTEKKDRSYTSMAVVGLGADRNFYLLDLVHDRLDLQGRATALFDLARKWSPYEIRYEKYSMQADIGHLKYRGQVEHFRIHGKIVEVGGFISKDDRIGWLIPSFNDGRWYFPRHLRRKRKGEDESTDLIRYFVRNELTKWPAADSPDTLDCLSRIQQPDLDLKWPSADYVDHTEKSDYMKMRIASLKKKNRPRESAWLA